MESLTRPGRYLFAISMAALGILNFIYSDTVAGLEPLPPWIPGRLFWAYLTGVVLIVAGACIAANKSARTAAVSLGIMLLLWVLLLQAPNMVVRPYDGNAWTTTFETLALCGAAWVLAGSLTTGLSLRQRWEDIVVSLAAPGRICFGVSMLVFGVLHFIYASFVATLIPVWMPGPRFWPYFTGTAFVAAGASIVTKLNARLAATLLGVMFGAWVLILHAPRVAANPGKREEWTSLLIAAAMCGGAWLVGGSLTRVDSAKRVDTSALSLHEGDRS